MNADLEIAVIDPLGGKIVGVLVVGQIAGVNGYAVEVISDLGGNVGAGGEGYVAKYAGGLPIGYQLVLAADLTEPIGLAGYIGGTLLAGQLGKVVLKLGCTLHAGGLDHQLGVLVIEPLGVDILVEGDLYAIVERTAYYDRGTGGLFIPVDGVVGYELYDLSLGNAALCGVASPLVLAAGSHESKGGSHGENHDQSQSDCENLLHFFKSLSIILCFASDGGFPPGEARFARPSA